jgi:hypothetical protein
MTVIKDRRTAHVWQRTDTVGTELVFTGTGTPPSADGTLVVTGPAPWAGTWQAELDGDDGVNALTAACHGDGWRRSLRLSRTAGGWSCNAEESGDLPARLHPTGGSADPSGAPASALVRLVDSPIFVTWALRRLRLTVADGPVTVPQIAVHAPSLTVVPGSATYQLLGVDRLRITTDGRATTFDLTEGWSVASRPGRLRLVR